MRSNAVQIEAAGHLCVAHSEQSAGDQIIDKAPSMNVPVLVLTGAVGVGKTTVATAAGQILRERDVAHAVVDLPSIGNSWPRPDDDPWNEALIRRNLACVWDNFRTAGARRLIVARVLEARSLLRHVETAVAGAEIYVVRLRATLSTVEQRIRRREASGMEDWYLTAARELVPQLEGAQVEDAVVDVDYISAVDAASAVLAAAHWV